MTNMKYKNMKYTHWVYWKWRGENNLSWDKGYEIITYGLGNHPYCVHWYETKEELDNAIKLYENDGYENRGAA